MVRIMVHDTEQTVLEAATHGKRQVSPRPYLPPEKLEAFFLECDLRHGPDPEPEPDWEEHLAAMEKSRIRGMFGK